MRLESQDDLIVAPLPRIFGRYLLIHRLSRGGMGEIFLARYGLAGFEKLAVIKKVLPHLAADEEFIERFVTEAQVAVKLQHANIAQVFEVGRVGDEYFLALEHIHGRDLRRTLSLLVDSGRGVPPDLALFIAREVANALAYAHRRVDDSGQQLGLVHCDISPPNVMMSFEGEVKIIDFGIAKSALKAMDENSKRGFGKFGYMAPEQLIRGRQVEARTDIYALGTVLFEMLTGTRLYELGQSPDYRALARMVAKGQHPVPSDHDPALAPYDELVCRALKPSVDDRYATAAEFRDEIQRHLVKLNPTISTDELAAFMRFMFAEDVLRQQEEIERLDKTQLSQWEDELGKDVQETVSFALGGVLDPASVDIAVPAEIAGALERSVREAELEEEPVPLVGDRTEIVGRSDDEPRKRRPVALWVAAAALLLGIGGAYAWSQRGAGSKSTGDKLAAKSTQTEALDASTEVVSAVNAAAPADGASSPIANPDKPPPTSDATASTDVASETSKGEKAKRDEAKREKDALKRAGTDKPDGDDEGDDDANNNANNTANNDANNDSPRPDAKAVADARKKFRRANSEYQRFRKKHGGQLHSEWTALLKFATFAKNDSKKAPKLVKKIDGFRAKMRKIDRDTL